MYGGMREATLTLQLAMQLHCPGDYKGYGTALASGNLTAYFANTVPGMPGSYSACLAPNAKIHQARLSFPSGHSALSFCAMTYMALMMYAWSVEAFGVLLPATAGAWAPGGMPVGAVNHNVEAGSRASADTPFLESPPPSQHPMSVSATKHGIGPKSPLHRNLAYVAAAYATRMVLPAGCLVVAALVATSRIINYWHNFDDVTAGGFLGAAVSVACFWAYQRSTVRGCWCLARFGWGRGRCFSHLRFSATCADLTTASCRHTPLTGTLGLRVANLEDPASASEDLNSRTLNPGSTTLFSEF